MYNLDMTSANGNMNLLTLDPGCNTPRTPEILNTLLNMQNPLDFIHGESKPAIKTSSLATSSLPNNTSASATTSTIVTTTTTLSSTAGPYINSDSSNSSSCTSQQECGGSSSFASAAIACNSVERNKTQLIKDSLKLTIELKRKQQCDQEDVLDLDQQHHHHHHNHIPLKRVKKYECSESDDDKMLPIHGLTPEDEERRRRRRERNKIAATKCRLKKRERTANLMTEAEAVEQQNVDYKTLIDQLRKERSKLEQVLETHRRQCVMNIPPATREKLSGGAVSRLCDGGGSVRQHQRHHGGYSSSSSTSSVTPVSTLSPTATNRPASADTTTYLHSTVELHPSHHSPAQYLNSPGSHLHNNHLRNVNNNQDHYHLNHNQLNQQQQLQLQQQYGFSATTPSITVIDDCGETYTPHLTDMDQPSGYDEYEYHYDGAGTTQNMFTLMT